MIDPISVSVGRTYAVTDAADCTVTDESGRVLCEHKAGSSQSYFTATTQTVTVTSATVHVTEVFNGAPAQNGSGGGILTPEQERALESVTDGSTVEVLPDSPDTYTLKQGAMVQLTEYTDTLELTPSALTTAQEMHVLYTPAEARTTQLIAVPDGVTLHWAGDEEPTWEAGKDYVIQLLQTSTTHIEARLFNAPQGAKLPEWLNTASYVARDSVTGVAVDARFEGQRDGRYQFEKDAASVTALADKLRTATFAEQIYGEYQFANLGLNVAEFSLPEATFESQTTGGYQFFNVLGSVPSSTLFLPKATFAALLNAGLSFQHNPSGTSHHIIYLPVATFENLGKGQAATDNLFAGCQAVIAPMATFRNMTSLYGFNRYVNSAGLPRVLELPSATFENVTTMGQLFYYTATPAPCMYSVNFRKLTSATDAWHVLVNLSVFGEEWRETFLSVVYGPRLDENGMPTPVTKTDAETGLPATRAVSELTGARLKGDGTRPTGWGIQDFRKVAADGTFERNDKGGYVHISNGHSFQLPTAASILPPELGGTSAAGEEVAEACRELSMRGWVIV